MVTVGGAVAVLPTVAVILVGMRRQAALTPESAAAIATAQGFPAGVWHASAAQRQEFADSFGREYGEGNGRVKISGDGTTVILQGRAVTDAETPLLISWFQSIAGAEALVERGRRIINGQMMADEPAEFPAGFEKTRWSIARACNFVVFSYNKSGDTELPTRIARVVTALRRRC
jgi:hypothetical protein